MDPDTPSVLEPETKYEFGAEAQGWHVVDFLEPPVTVEQLGALRRGLPDQGRPGSVARRHRQLHPVRPGDDDCRLPPRLRLCWGPSSPTPRRRKPWPRTPACLRSTSRRRGGRSRLASQNPSTEQLVNIMHTYAKGDTIDFDDEEGAEAWLLWAKAASACGASLTVTCVLNNAAAVKNWDAGGIRGADCQLDALQQEPPALAVFRHPEARIQGNRLRQGDHQAYAVHLELQPQERRASDRATAAETELPMRMGPAGRGEAAHCIVLAR